MQFVKRATDVFCLRLRVPSVTVKVITARRCRATPVRCFASQASTVNDVSRLSAKAQDCSKQAEQLWRRGNFRGAETLLVTAVSLYERAGEHGPVGRLLVNAAFAAQQQQKWDDAERWYRRALEPVKQAFGSSSIYGSLLANLAEVCAQKENYAEAISYCRESLEFFDSSAQELIEPEYKAALLTNLSTFLFAEKQYEESKRVLERSLQLFVERLGPDNVFVRRCLANLARVSEALGAPDDVNKKADSLARKLEEHLAALRAAAAADGAGENIEQFTEVWKSKPVRVFEPPGIIFPKDVLERETAAFQRALASTPPPV